MTRVLFNVRLSESHSLTVDHEVDLFGVQIGAWYVELIGGYLIVRDPERPVNDPAILRIPVER